MKFSNRYTGILIFSLFILNCSTVNGSGLDIAEYLQLADSGIVYPSARQIEMLKVVMPEYNYQPAPPVSNRGYWDLIADSESGKEYLKNAISKLDKEPEIPITDDIYREANLKGSRHLYKCKYYRTMERLENFILAECIENQKRFLPQICIYLRAIINMKSWLHPNHDTKDNIVLEGKSIAIDIGARKFGTDLALAEVLLRDKLPDGLRKEMANHLQRRIIDCYLKGCSEKLATHLTWFKGYSNWNSVCTSGSLFVTIAFSNDADERLASVGCALNSMNNYLSGFGEDGYCSEGINYWDYGFGHYLYLAQILYDYTGGKIDLFYADNPKKLKNIGNFPENYHIQNGIYAPFSDGSSSFPNGDGFTFLMSARYYGTILPQGMGESSMNFPDEAVYQLIAWEHPGILNMEKGAASVEPKLPGYSSFHESGVVISRGKQDVPFSIAMKAGNNWENHNHSDVGTYIIVLGKDFITGDIGAPSYVAGAFHPDNKARSSWGHPVPIIDHSLQSNGKKFSGVITSTKFSEISDRVVMDLKGAYESPALEELIRTIVNDKSISGSISIEDRFSSLEPLQFGTAIMTFCQYDIQDDHTIILISENYKVIAKILGEGASLEITDERVPVEHLKEGDSAYRIGISFTKPITRGKITVIVRPL